MAAARRPTPTAAAAGGNELICAVCKEVYRSPRFLPCFHTFCLYCLENLSKIHGGKYFPCPSCRRNTAVPPGGVVKFQVNFYITETQLKAVRNKPNATLCPEPVHQPSVLEFYCVACDAAICLKCKLTKHERHNETLDLAKEAAKGRGQLKASKGRLEEAVRILTEKSVEANKHLSAAKQKGIQIKAEIQAAADDLVARVLQRREATLQQFDKFDYIIGDQLSIDACAIRLELDTLLQLQQRVHQGLGVSASHAEVVDVRREMREGQGKAERLQEAVSNCSPVTTQRLGLRVDHSSFSDSDIDRYLGVPAVLTLPFDAAPEKVVPIFRCGRDGDCRQVHIVCPAEDNLIYVMYGGELPGYANSTLICVDDQGEEKKCELVLERSGNQNKFYFLNRKIAQDMLKRRPMLVTGGQEYFRHLRDGVFLETRQENDTTQSVMKIETRFEFSSHTEFSPTRLFEVQCGRAVAFNMTEDGRLFAFVGEKACEQRKSCKYTVLLYRCGQREAFSAYRPPDVSAFRPTDVCFWRQDGERGEKLLVADEHNDAVHVVTVEDDNCRFDRYLAAGDGRLVRPTALSVDRLGRVWIGCRNGSILRCCCSPSFGQGLKASAGCGDSLSVSDSSEEDLQMDSLIDTSDSDVSDEVDLGL